jgi:hypothetical protein
MMGATLKYLVQRTEHALHLPARPWVERRQGLFQHVAVLEWVTTGTARVGGVLQQLCGRPMNGASPRHQSTSDRTGPQTRTLDGHDLPDGSGAQPIDRRSCAAFTPPGKPCPHHRR